MKYVITGSAGNISKPLAESLLAKGNEVTVISRKAENISELTEMGAKPAIGSIENIDFLTKSFRGADAVYTMVPPNMAATDWKSYIESIGKNYTAAIKAAGVKYIVNLSSIGAHMYDGCGPVSGIHRAENALNSLVDVHIKHLRPGYFYLNLLSQIPMIKKIGIMGSNFGGDDSKLVLSHPDDIAKEAEQELLNLNFSGHSLRYLASDEKTSAEIAKAFGDAIGNGDLKWVLFNDEQALAGALQAGLPEEIAKNYIEMGAALRTGKMEEDYLKHKPAVFGKTKLDSFAKFFASVYGSEKAVAAH